MNGPVQHTLLGMPEPAAPLELRMALVGQARRRAELRVSPDGQHAWLVVELAQPSSSSHTRPPFHAALHGTSVPEMQAKAERIRLGVLVLVTCRGLEWDHTHQLLRAWRCDAITPIPAGEAAQFTPDAALDDATHPEHTS